MKPASNTQTRRAKQPEKPDNNHPETVLRFDYPADQSFALLVATLARELKKQKAEVRARWDNCGATVRVQGMTPEKVKQTLHTIYPNADHVSQRQVAPTELPIDDGELPASVGMHRKLTRWLFMILPTGHRVVVTCGLSFNEVLGPHATREAAWQRIIKSRANGRMFMCVPPGSKIDRIFGRS